MVREKHERHEKVMTLAICFFVPFVFFADSKQDVT